MIKQIEGYTIFMDKLLGCGSYGSVYMGKCAATEEKVAIKIISRDKVDGDEYLCNSLHNEIEILRRVLSDNIIQFYDMLHSTNNYYIVQELCDNDLSSIIKKGQQLSEQECIDIIKQVTNGFVPLVKEGIVHRDLKPANILQRGKVFKIGDFGFSKQLASGQVKCNTTVGTPSYMSLQILKSEEYTNKCDIWALGVIFYELLHGSPPWKANCQYQLINCIENTPLVIPRKDLSQEALDFLQQTLQVKEESRISWDKLFSHPIFQDYFSSVQIAQFTLKLDFLLFKLKGFNFDGEALTDKLMNFGCKTKDSQLSFEQFQKFLTSVEPSLKTEDCLILFEGAKRRSQNAITVEEISNMLMLPFIENLNGDKMIVTFQRLCKIAERNQLSIKKVFKDFDKEGKGYLTIDDFKSLVTKINKSITSSQIERGFKQITGQSSEKVPYKDFLQYYFAVNKIEPFKLQYTKSEITENTIPRDLPKLQIRENVSPVSKDILPNKRCQSNLRENKGAGLRSNLSPPPKQLPKLQQVAIQQR